MSTLAPLHACIRATNRRVRLQRVLNVATLVGVAGLSLAALAVLRARLTSWHDSLASALLVAARLVPVMGAVISALRRLEPLSGAQLLDRSHGLHDLLSSAWAFSQLPVGARSRFMDATVEQALAEVAQLSPARAMPLSCPPHSLALLLLAAGVLCIGQLRVHGSRPATQPRAELVQLLPEDDLDAYRAELSHLNAIVQPVPQLAAASKDLNDLLEALADRRVSRARALQKLREIETQLERAKPASETQQAALRELGRALKPHRVTEQLADALSQANAAAASAEMQRLAQRTRAEKPDSKTLDALRKALREATAEEPRKAREEREQTLRSQIDALRGKSEEQAGQDEESLLKKKKQQLQALLDQERQRREQERQLDKLERDLQHANEKLAQQRPQDSAEDLERAAQELHQMQEQREAARGASEMQQRVADLRELMRRQQATGGATQRERSASQSGSQSGTGDQGQRGAAAGGTPKPLTMDGWRALAGGQQGASSAPGADQKGAALLAPGKQGSAQGSLLVPTAEQQSASSGGSGAVRAGQRAGTSGGPPKSAAVTGLASDKVDSRVTGQSGRGPTRSEIIYEAAGRGFASRAYQQVHSDYQRHAESEIEHDDIPGGYRFYVRRYFQLIRPREDVHD